MVADVMERITVDEIDSWRELSFTIEGTQPILMHNPKGNLGQRPTGDAKPGKKVVLSAEDEAERGAYRLSDGTLYISVLMMRASVLAAAARIPVQGKRYSMKYLLRGALQIDSACTDFPLVNANDEPIHNYTVDERRVVIGTAAVERARPCIELPWFLTARFLFDVNGPLTIKVVQDIIQSAGKTQGIGDFRPSCDGYFGTFRLRSIGLR